jgi:hypothetical protein
MTDKRNIIFNSHGTYNESVQVHGDFVQGNQTVNNSFSQDITTIQNLLIEFQKQYSTEEAAEKTAQELVVRAQSSPAQKKRLIDVAKYVASNGGIEASIGKAVELALKLLVGI